MAWNDETNSPDFFTQGQGSEYLRVDADKETLVKWEKYQEEENKRIAKIEDEWNSRIPKKGSRIRTIKGRTCPKGTEGEVYAIYDNNYSYTNKYNKIIYFLDSEGNKWKTYTDNIEILVGQEWLEPRWEVESRQMYICSGTY